MRGTEGEKICERKEIGGRKEVEAKNGKKRRRRQGRNGGGGGGEGRGRKVRSNRARTSFLEIFMCVRR